MNPTAEQIIHPAVPRTPAEHAVWVGMDADASFALNTGRYFTEIVARSDYPGDPATWDQLAAMDAKLRTLHGDTPPHPDTTAPPDRGRIPAAPVDYLRTLAELDQTSSVAAAKEWGDEGGTGSAGMLLVGSTGTGKTSVAAAVCVEFGNPGAFWPIRDLLAALRAADFDGSDSLAGRRFRDTLHARALLVIDDLGVERGTDYERDFVRGLLETRCSRPVATVVTTNLTRAAREQYLGARVTSRLTGWRQVAVLGPDRRRTTA